MDGEKAYIELGLQGINGISTNNNTLQDITRSMVNEHSYIDARHSPTYSVQIPTHSTDKEQ